MSDEIEIADMIAIHPALIVVLPEILRKIGEELAALEREEPRMDHIQQRVMALNGPDRTAAFLDCSVMFAALYATFRAMERQKEGMH